MKDREHEITKCGRCGMAIPVGQPCPYCPVLDRRGTA